MVLSEGLGAERHNWPLLEPALWLERWSRAKTHRANVTLPFFLQLKGTYCTSHRHYAVRPLRASVFLSEPLFHFRVGEPRNDSIEHKLTATVSRSYLSSIHPSVRHCRGSDHGFLSTTTSEVEGHRFFCRVPCSGKGWSGRHTEASRLFMAGSPLVSSQPMGLLVLNLLVMSLESDCLG